MKVRVTSILTDVESDLSFSNVRIIDGLFAAGFTMWETRDKLAKSGYQVQGEAYPGLNEDLCLFHRDSDYHIDITITITATIEEEHA